MRILGVIGVCADLYVIEVPIDMMDGRRFAKVRGTIAGRSITALAGSSGAGPPGLLLPADFVEGAGLHAGDVVEVDVVIISGELPSQRVHPLLRDALGRRGVSLEFLPEYERRQLLTSVNEAGSMDVRLRRIEAVLAACLAARNQCHKEPGN